MVEIAEEVFQCPECGAGKTSLFWSLVEVVIEGFEAHGTAYVWNSAKPNKQYAVSTVLWSVDSSDRVISGTVEQELIGVIQDSLSDEPLPVISKSGGQIKLSPHQWSPLGEKIL